MRLVSLILSVAASAAAFPALSAETITYSYDAKGRVVTVVHTGTANNNLNYAYTYDAVSNRKELKVTNSPNPPPH